MRTPNKYQKPHTTPCVESLNHCVVLSTAFAVLSTQQQQKQHNSSRSNKQLKNRQQESTNKKETADTEETAGSGLQTSEFAKPVKEHQKHQKQRQKWPKNVRSRENCPFKSTFSWTNIVSIGPWLWSNYKTRITNTGGCREASGVLTLGLLCQGVVSPGSFHVLAKLFNLGA